MRYLPYLLLGFAASMLLLQLRVLVASRRLRGQPAPPIDDLLGEQAATPRLIYFFSEQCPPCRAMTPHVDRLASREQGVVKVDVTRAPEAARRYGIRVTPTVVVVRDGTIGDVALGALSARRLESLLT